MKYRKLKPFVIPSLYSLIVVFVSMSVYFLSQAVPPQSKEELVPKFDYVIKSLLTDDVPVGVEQKVIERPYLATNITIAKPYYDEKETAEKQEKALIYYENTYLQNSGVDYVSSESFAVVSVLEGTVLKVEENNLLGNIIEIRHTNDLISVYQCLSEVEVKENDRLEQGEVIGKSGVCNITRDLEHHLHFEILHKGQVKNPELFYEKTIAELADPAFHE